MRRLALIAVMVLAACSTDAGAPASGGSAVPPKNAHVLDTETPLDDRYMKLAKKAEKDGNAEMAAIMYRAAAMANEKDPAPRAASAELFEKAGEYKPAAGLYDALAQETDNTDYILAAGRNLLKAGDLEAAKAHYETAIVKAPADYRGFNGLAVTSDFMENHKAAQSNYAIAFEKAPEKMKASVAMNHALSLMLDGQPAEAAKKLEPLPDAAESPPIRQRLALAYALSGRPDDAKRLGLVKIPTNEDLQKMLKGGMRGDDADHVYAPVKP